MSVSVAEDTSLGASVSKQNIHMQNSVVMTCTPHMTVNTDKLEHQQTRDDKNEAKYWKQIFRGI